MKIVLSPAKTLDYTTPPPSAASRLPRFRAQAGVLAARLKTMDAGALGSLMTISDALAEENAERYRRFSVRFTDRNSRQALFAFDGDVYDGLDAYSLAPSQITRADEQIRILSGLYGLLRPLDRMQPYRLEMGTRLDNPRGRDLYAFWRGELAARLARELRGDPYPVLVNLASDEYFRSVDVKALRRRVVQPVFEEFRPDAVDGAEWKVISFQAKRARGRMTRFALDRQIDDPESLKDFDCDGYRYDPVVSGPDRWVFRRGDVIR